MAPERQTTAQQLRCLHMFRRLPEEVLQAISTAAEPVGLRPAETLIRQGDVADSFFIVTRGRLQVTIRRGKREQPVATLSNGDSIGEEELFHRHPRMVSVTALEDTSLLRWRNNNFTRWMIAHPPLRTSLWITSSSRRQARAMNLDWLRKSEGVQLIARKHPFFLFRSLVVPVLAFAAVAVAFTYLYLAGAQSLVPFLCAGGLLAAAGLWAGWNVLDWSNDYYLVTNQRVVWLERVAAFYDSRQEAPLSTLLSVGVKTDQIGRIFDYGDVQVRTYTGTITFHRVSHPERAADLIEDLWQRARVESKQEEIAAMDLFVVPTIGFDLLYAFVIVRLDRRDLVWINVTTNPTAEWIARQIMEAFPWDDAPQHLIRDRDRIYGTIVTRRLRAMGIRDKPTAPASPWQNGFAERLIGSIRRECVDHFVVLGEAHLRRILRAYARYYNDVRTHRSLDKDAPVSRPVQRTGIISSHAILGGLHHHYVRV